MTVTPGMRMVIYDIRPEAPILTGLDALLVQGWPLQMIESILRRSPCADNLMLDLAGNGFCGGVFGAVLTSCWL